MDYKKLYKEALERARAINSGEDVDVSAGTTICEYIFPELQESEDERIRQYFISAVEEQVDIHQDWKEKCLNWLKERGSEKNGWLFEKGKWYVKLCHDYDGDLRHLQKGNVYQAISETCITDGYHHISLGSWEIPMYFRPADKDEIPLKIEQSDDEKIRKELITHCRNTRCVTEEGAERMAKWIAWLEKQGKSSDQIHYWTEEEIEPIISDYIRGAEHYGGMIARLRCLKPKSLEKQGEQRPVNIDIESMVSSYKQRLKSQGAIENTPLLNLPLAAFRHGVENVLEELNLKKLEKQGDISTKSVHIADIPFGAKDSELQEATYFIPKGYYAKIEGDKVVVKKGEEKPATIDVDKMVDDYARSNVRDNEEFGKPLPCMIRAYRQGLNDAINEKNDGSEKL